MKVKKYNPRNEKPVSLHPLNLEDALKKAMQTKPHTVQDTSSALKQPDLGSKRPKKA